MLDDFCRNGRTLATEQDAEKIDGIVFLEWQEWVMNYFHFLLFCYICLFAIFKLRYLLIGLSDCFLFSIKRLSVSFLQK
jgi:hypothetical protein